MDRQVDKYIDMQMYKQVHELVDRWVDGQVEVPQTDRQAKRTEIKNLKY
jgi:hypothetical protein